ncbi:Bardet-Biedl syndrome 7 protein [Tetrabaena socialis]|uniref:Bardet-Biedl syndrome 7 protein n=1 Tax=Tetrabaena socialis TaxID=47790 RepID=A0A2J8A886_9CHLO|nr:Bardet-Biedl syndrome 7 protein [Tetrabaena socialis]|eukprot:PNH08710.1 Bardet-Biedl syndrome 7 protein [Tetrabaena socialis]
MELELFRQDLIQTSTCASGTLAVLPRDEEKKTQKVAAGDLSGVVQCFSVKKGEFTVAFKTLPAAANKIKGVNKKGKEFFKFNTQLTETIRRVDISEKNIWSAGEYVHNHFIEGRDKALYLCPDRINDAEVVPLAGPNDLWPVLACQDRYVRVLRGSEVCYEAPTPAAPVSLQYVLDSHDPQNRFPNAKEVLYGTDNGGSRKYRGGEARFVSDLVSTLGIIHETVMREATAAKLRVTVSFNPSAQSLQHSVALVWPQLEKQRTLKKTFFMLEGLQELRMQDGDVSYLTEEYRSVLDRADKIRQEYKEQPQHLDHLVALIKDLYLDFCKLTGVSTPKQRLPALEQLLNDTSSTLEQLMEFLTGQR